MNTHTTGNTNEKGRCVDSVEKEVHAAYSVAMNAPDYKQEHTEAINSLCASDIRQSLACKLQDKDCKRFQVWTVNPVHKCFKHA